MLALCAFLRLTDDLNLYTFAFHDRSPDSVAATKELYQSTWVDINEAECLKKETELQMKLIGTYNQIAASGRQFGINLPYFQRKD